MNIAVMPLAECAPLLLTPDMKPPGLLTWRARKSIALVVCMIRSISALGMTASAMTRLPRVRSNVDLGALLVGRERALEEVLLDVGELADDPAACLLRGLAGHVLPRRVTGRVVEARVDVPRGRVALDLREPAAAGRRLGGRLDLVEVLVEPAAEDPRLPRAGHDEDRCALHPVGHDRRLHPASLIEKAHAAVVARHQRPLGRRHRHVELALRMLSVDEQGPGETDRDLGDAEELLDVAARDRRVERVVRDVLEHHPGPLAHEAPALLRRLLGVVVLAVTRDRGPLPGSGRRHARPRTRVVFGYFTPPGARVGGARPWRRSGR